jgi:hypothetical protein
MTAKIVVNCAGWIRAPAQQLSEKKLTIVPRKGEYYLLDHQRRRCSPYDVQTPPPWARRAGDPHGARHDALARPPRTKTTHRVSHDRRGAEDVGKSEATWPGETSQRHHDLRGIRAHEVGGRFCRRRHGGRTGRLRGRRHRKPRAFRPRPSPGRWRAIAAENGLTRSRTGTRAQTAQGVFAMTAEEKQPPASATPPGVRWSAAASR